MGWGIGSYTDYSGMRGLGLGMAPADWTYLKGLLIIGPNDPYGRVGGDVPFAAQLAYAMLPDISRGSGFALTDEYRAQLAAVERGDYIAAFGPTWPVLLAAAKQAAMGDTSAWSAIAPPNVPLASIFGGPTASSGAGWGGGYDPTAVFAPGATPPAAVTPPATGGGGGVTPPPATKPPAPPPPPANAEAKDNTMLYLGIAAAAIGLLLVTKSS